VSDMSIVDLLIMFIGGIILFWLFIGIVINPVNKTIDDISSKKEK